MKNLNKIVSGLMVLSMGAGVAVTLPQSVKEKVSAETENSFVVTGFDTEKEIGDTVTLPEVTGVTRTVKDPKGSVVTLSENAFTASKIGTYTVTYSKDIANSIGKSVQEYKIVVTGDLPTINFASNIADIIPTTTNYSKAIKLPTPTVEDSDGNEIEGASISVKVTAPDHTEVTKEVSGSQVSLSCGDSFTPNKEGIYTITYKYINSSNTLASKTFTVTAKQSYDSSNILLVHSLNSSMPTSLNLGVETTLPTISVTDSNNSNASVNAYYTISVTNKTTGKVYTVTNNKFTPMDSGKYSVKYTINDFFGSKLSGSSDNTYTYQIDKAEDTTAPVPMFVDAYSISDVSGSTTLKSVTQNLVNAETSVDSKVYIAEGSSKTKTFPAIFATDAYEIQKVESAYQYTPANLTFTRKLINENGTTVFTWQSADSTAVATSTSAYAAANATVSYEFTKSGTYKLEYTAKDSYGSSTKTLSIEVKIGLDTDDASAPTIEFDAYKSAYVKAGETVSFAKPTVTDYLNASATDKVIGDTRVWNKSYYYYNTVSEAASVTTLAGIEELVTAGKLIELVEDEDNEDNFAFTLPKTLGDKTKVTIITYAKDDINSITNKSYEIKILNVISDSAAPTIVGGGNVEISGDGMDKTGSEANIDQLKTVNVGTLTLTDADENFGATISVKYFKDATSEPVDISLSGMKTTYNKTAKTITLSDVKFQANNVGTYVISVVGKDLNGNTIVKSTSVSTNDVIAPEISVSWNYTNVELGKTITLPQVDVYDNGVKVEDADVTIEISGPSYVLNGNEFTPLTNNGDYQITFTADDGSGNTTSSNVFTLHAEDTTAPEVRLEDMVFPETASYTSGATNTVLIPGFIASDINGINLTETKVTVKNSSGTDFPVTASGDNWTFTPTSNGTYTVTYTAVDKAGLKTEKEYTVKVGDVTSPTITISDATHNKPSSKKVGDVLSLNLDSITVSDAVDTELNTEDDLTVTVYDPSNNIISAIDGQEYSYNLTSQGEYRIVYSVTDNAGNTETYTHTFQVNAKTTTAGITTETIGIILICVSIVLLGGVVFYFFKTRKIVK